MKKLFFLLIILISLKGFGQVYQVMPQYGYQMQRADIQQVLRIPSDTTNNKTGIARIGTTLYTGNGTYWAAVTGGGGGGTDTSTTTGFGLIKTIASNNINLKVDSATVATQYKLNLTNAQVTANTAAITQRVTYANLTDSLTQINMTRMGDSISLNINGRTFKVKDSTGCKSYKNPNNPITTILPNPILTSAYVPTPIRLNNGDLWVYVKDEVYGIYGWKSTDNGTNWTYQGNMIAPGTSGAWDDTYALDPYAYYNPANDTIYLYYKGGKVAPNSLFGIGLATAKGSNPTSFTKDTDPILSAASFRSQMSTLVSQDLLINSTVLKDGVWHFYVSYMDSLNRYSIVHGSGSNIRQINNCTKIIEPLTGYDLAYAPTVFKDTGLLYRMILTDGFVQWSQDACPNDECDRFLTQAYSTDLINWNRIEGRFLTKDTLLAQEEYRVYAAHMLKGGINNDSLLKINGYYQFYYSSSGFGANAGVGNLLYVCPNDLKVTPQSSEYVYSRKFVVGDGSIIKPITDGLQITNKKNVPILRTANSAVNDIAQINLLPPSGALDNDDLQLQVLGTNSSTFNDFTRTRSGVIYTRSNLVNGLTVGAETGGINFVGNAARFFGTTNTSISNFVNITSNAFLTQSTYLTNGYTPLIGSFSTTNNPTKTKTLIAARVTDDGSELSFNVANSYAVGADQEKLKLSVFGVSIPNLTTNGYVKTSGGTGLLGVSTSIPQADVTNLTTDLAAKQANITMQDEGVAQGAAGANTTINFTGSGVTATNSGSTLTVNVAGGGASGITVGTTTITSGTSGRVAYNNGGVYGEYSITGTGNVMLSASPTTTGTLTAAAANLSGKLTLTTSTAGSVTNMLGMEYSSSSVGTGISSQFTTIGGIEVGGFTHRRTAVGSYEFFINNWDGVSNAEAIRIKSFAAAGSNSVGIGGVSPTAKLHVLGTVRLQTGNEGAGKILQSDASGNADWVTPTFLASSNFVYNEEFTGSTSSTYTLANTPITGKLVVFKNGLKLPNSEFSLSGTTVTLTSARLITDVFSNDYIK